MRPNARRGCLLVRGGEGEGVCGNEKAAALLPAFPPPPPPSAPAEARAARAGAEAEGCSEVPVGRGGSPPLPLLLLILADDEEEEENEEELFAAPFLAASSRLNHMSLPRMVVGVCGGACCRCCCCCPCCSREPWEECPWSRGACKRGPQVEEDEEEGPAPAAAR